MKGMIPALIIALAIIYAAHIYSRPDPTHLGDDVRQDMVQEVKPRDTGEKIANTRFSDNGNGTVKDNKTGLTWMRCSIGQSWQTACFGPPDYFSWEAAIQFATNFSYAGQHGWRVPSIEELDELVDCKDGRRDAFNEKSMGGICMGTTIRPVIDLQFFPQTIMDWYWSSTPYSYETLQLGRLISVSAQEEQIIELQNMFSGLLGKTKDFIGLPYLEMLLPCTNYLNV